MYISVCSNNTFFINGQQKPCKGHCRDCLPCNKYTGRCDNGCDNHWTGDFCDGIYEQLLQHTLCLC